MLVAQHIAHGPMPLTDDCTRSFSDEKVRELARRVFVSEDPAATAAYPGRQPTSMKIILRDGTSHTASCERILGESDHPLPSESLAAKFMELAQPAWGANTHAIWSDLVGIRDVTDVGSMIARWRKTATDHQQGGRS
jgi:2-methylcitrate dehydratase PrpD